MILFLFRGPSSSSRRPMFRSFFTLSFLTAGLFAVGCIGDTPAVTEAEACTAMARAVCAKLLDCSPILKDSQYADNAACIAREELRCAPILHAEGSKTTPADIKACADGYFTISCDDILSDHLSEPCRPTPGTLANGSPCGLDTQCASTKCVTNGEPCGVCAEPIAARGACTTNEECARGLTCANNVCTALGARGAACNPASCLPSLVCVNNVCEKPVLVGKPCNGMGAADNCAQLLNYICGASNQCEQIKVATSAGSPCGWVDQDFVFCQAKGHCRMAPMMTSGTCIAAAEDGAACDDAQGPECLPGALCINGVCTLNDATTCN